MGAGAVGLPDVHDLFLGLGVQYAEEQRCQKKGLSHNLKLEILQYGYGKAACQRAAATGSASRQGVPFQALPTPLDLVEGYAKLTIIMLIPRLFQAFFCNIRNTTGRRGSK